MKTMEKFDTKISEIIRKCEGKNVILYGYGESGQFLEWYFGRIYGKQFMCVIDDTMCIPGRSIQRTIILEYIDPDETMILSSIEKSAVPVISLARMEACGYTEGENLLFLTDEIAPIQFSFYDWMEHDCGVDLKTKVETKDFDYEAGNATASGPSRQRSLFDICKIPGMVKEPVLDFGCGKGAALAIMLAAGIKEAAGIEKSQKLSDTARSNLNKIGGELVEIFTLDATEATDLLDRYNTFYLYDPFRGDTFRKVIDHIEDSVRRTKRHVRIIYANPWLHKEVEKNGIFRLTKQVNSEFFLNIVNEYENI